MKRDYIDVLNDILNDQNNQKNKFDKVIEHIKNFWWIYVVFALTSGIIILFGASLVYDKEITLNVMNSWVGVILGLIALVIGIISMILSFYNLDQSIRTQKETLDKIDGIKKEIIDYIEKTSKETQETVKETNRNNTKTEKSNYDVKNDKGGWYDASN